MKWISIGNDARNVKELRMPKSVNEVLQVVMAGKEDNSTEDEFMELCEEVDSSIVAAWDELITNLKTDDKKLGILMNKLGCINAQIVFEKFMSDERVHQYYKDAVASFVDIDELEEYTVNLVVSGFLYGIHFSKAEMK